MNFLAGKPRDEVMKAFAADDQNTVFCSKQCEDMYNDKKEE